MAAGDIFAWKMAPLIDPMAGGSVLALPDTLEGNERIPQRRHRDRRPRRRQHLGGIPQYLNALAKRRNIVGILPRVSGGSLAKAAVAENVVVPQPSLLKR